MCNKHVWWVHCGEKLFLSTINACPLIFTHSPHPFQNPGSYPVLGVFVGESCMSKEPERVDINLPLMARIDIIIIVPPAPKQEKCFPLQGERAHSLYFLYVLNKGKEMN